MTRSSKAMSIRSAAGWLLSAAVVARPTGVLASAILARVLGPAGFGLLGVLTATAGLATTIGTLGLQTGIQRHVARNGNPAKLRLALLLNGLMACVVTGAIAVFWKPISRYLGVPVSRELCWLLAAVTFLQIVLAARNAVIAGRSEFRILAVQNIQLNVASAVLMIPLALYAGVTGAVVALCIVTLMITVRAGTFARQLAPRSGQDSDPSAVLFVAGVPVILADIAGQMCLWWLITGLGARSGPQQVGLFRAAQTLNGLILFVPAAINPLVLSHLAARSAVADRFREGTAEIARIMWMITLPVVAVTVTWRRPLLQLLFGPAFDAAAPAVGIMVWQALFAAVGGGVLWQGLVGYGRPLASAAVAAALFLGTFAVTTMVVSSSARDIALCYLLIHGAAVGVLATYVNFRLGVSYERLRGLTVVTVILVLFTWMAGRTSPSVGAVLGVVLLCACVGVQWRFLLSDSERATCINGVAQSWAHVRASLRAFAAGSVLEPAKPRESR